MPARTNAQPSQANPSHASLAAALCAFQSEMPTVAKGETANVPTKNGGSYSYKYADLADVVQAGTPVLTRHGLSFNAQPRHVVDGAYELVGVLRHESGESCEGALPLFGRTPQEIGSSITYNRRYLFGCLTGLITDEDNDGARATGAPRTQRQQRPAQPPAQQQNGNGQAPPADADLEAAKGHVWQCWTALTAPERHTIAEVTKAYEQHTAQPLADADAADLHRFAGQLENGEVSL